ncbi:MAG: hypothetical protein Q4G25_02330, partial [Paracoccus sp. (in: a-proteobacteria)]|nr:hypothetical protein [Paracoccus sp. (in: a-proteobacteria)]
MRGVFFGLAALLGSTALGSAALASCYDSDNNLISPHPSKTTTGGQVCNPHTNTLVNVTGVVTDPAGSGSSQTVFVKTSDGQVFLVKGTGDYIYGDEPPHEAMRIDAVENDPDTGRQSIKLSVPGADQPDYVPIYMTQAEYDTFAADTGGDANPNPGSNLNSSSQITHIQRGANGANGKNARWIFKSPTRGGDGARGPDVNANLSGNVTATSNIGVTIGSEGGSGGKGGSVTFAWWGAADGGNAGDGGNVNASYGGTVTTQGTGNHGIRVYSTSGQGGNAGDSKAGMGGGDGGAAANGGNVTFTNNGTVTTHGNFAYGVLGQSFGNIGGSGGSQWGLVGKGGAGGAGGKGGWVDLTNAGNITTHGRFSHGVVAQSVGGDGGNAGNAYNVFLSAGQNGGIAGNGDAVTVTNSGRIETRGDYAYGILAQSVGGGGGAAGRTLGLIAIGGMAESGGNGAKVTVTNDASGVISTTGTGATGIFAQSVGGSGGRGGLTAGLVSIGGDAGNGGKGGDVDVINRGWVTTSGAGARGIVAQSVGGGGGDAGGSIGWVTVGGTGGGGGDGGTVRVTHSGVVRTTGADATAIMAQSVGGGGGDGGRVTGVGLFAVTTIGGTGGQGGKGGDVTINLEPRAGGLPAEISTTGARSHAIFAQSVGGGGGNGGHAQTFAAGIGGTVTTTIGGTGGVGGAGGTVVMNAATGTNQLIATKGENATAIVLQSIGGGGGNGGNARSFSASVVAGINVGTTIGGTGGAGGHGGTVRIGTETTAGFRGAIVTEGANSIGLLAQSLGGGGGTGGDATSVGANVSLASLTINTTRGGKGSTGGDGGVVTANLAGHVETSGLNASGVVIQSIGGGGGNGGDVLTVSAGASLKELTVTTGTGGNADNGGAGGRVIAIMGDASGTDVASRGSVVTHGHFATGILAQSVGGGGGSGGNVTNGNFSIAGASITATSQTGGSGGAGGAGGHVTGRLYADVGTSGMFARGAVFQSIGGGGGAGGDVITAAASVNAVGMTANMGVGGKGGAASSGGRVDVTTAGNLIETSGFASTGLLVQSVGGGGGAGGSSISASGGASLAVNITGTMNIGGSAGGGGAGGIVTADLASDIITRGFGAQGAIVQSIGGGGGTGGFSVAGTLSAAGLGGGGLSGGLGGSGGSGGAGGQVTAKYSGNINTLGGSATGLLVQSIGGGGGAGGYNVAGAIAAGGVGSGGESFGMGGTGGGGGRGGAVGLELAHSRAVQIVTSGFGSGGVVAQSVGGGGGAGGYNIAGTVTAAGTGT